MLPGAKGRFRFNCNNDNNYVRNSIKSSGGHTICPPPKMSFHCFCFIIFKKHTSMLFLKKSAKLFHQHGFYTADAGAAAFLFLNDKFA